MKLIPKNRLLAVAIALALPVTASAGNQTDDLKRQVEALQKQLQAIQAQLDEQQKQTEAVKTEVKDVAKASTEWKDATSVVHLAGYGSVGYSDNENTDGRFSQVQFSPIFHYQYKDLMMLESELEIRNDPDGETTTDMEYLSLDLILNDYATLVAGKFLSPVGQFRQNYHPGWINKLPSAPPGFGHDGAAPVSDTGMQLRGGFPLSSMRANYAVYVSNGPELQAVDENGDNLADEIESILAEGRTSDTDGDKVWGGRFGLLPMDSLEVGASFATGKALITKVVDEDENDVTSTVTNIGSETNRDYDVIGMDFNWKVMGADLRGEYVRAKVGNAAGSALDGAEWKTWYTQASYLFTPTNFEGVLRYTDFNAPGAAEDQKQWAIGLNYLFAPNVIAKIAYEANDGQAGAPADDDSVLVQMAYGF